MASVKFADAVHENFSTDHTGEHSDNSEGNDDSGNVFVYFVMKIIIENTIF